MFQTPIGLLALAAVPAVVALHLFRRRFRPQAVSALFLWGRYDESVRTGRTLERLHRSPSFWCEVLAAMLLALALGGPRACGSGEVPHLVVVVDTSASMGARGRDGSTFNERALQEVRTRLARLPSSGRATLIASGARPEVLAGPAAEPERVRAALALIEPTRLGHDLARSVALALELAGDGAVLLLTDRLEVDGLAPAVEVLAFGESVENVALARATRRRMPGLGSASAHDRVFLAVRNFGWSERSVEATVQAVPATQGAGVGAPWTLTLRFDVAAGGRASGWVDLPSGAGPAEVRLMGDALDVDNVALLAPDVPRVVRLRSELDAPLEAWLGLAERDAEPGDVTRLVASLPDVELVAPGAPAHVSLARRSPRSSETWGFVVPELGGERADYAGPFLREVQHPALAGATLRGCLWSADPELSLPGRPLVRAGDLALLSEAARGAADASAMDLWINLDPYRSSLHRSPDWPVLLANLVERRRAELPGPRASNLLVGESYEWRGESAAPLRLVGPGLERELAPASPMRTAALDRPGLYQLVTGGGEPVATFGVHFADPAESDLRDVRPGVRTAQGSLARVLADTGWLETVLAAAAVVLLLVDWLVLAGWRNVLTPARTV